MVKSCDCSQRCAPLPLATCSRSQVTWQMSVNSEEVTRMAWTFTHTCKRCPWYASASTCILAHICTHSWVLIGRGPIIVPTRQWWQDRDSKQLACLLYLLMNTCEFTERSVVVKDTLGIDKPLILISHLNYYRPTCVLMLTSSMHAILGVFLTFMWKKFIFFLSVSFSVD